MLNEPSDGCLRPSCSTGLNPLLLLWIPTLIHLPLTSLCSQKNTKTTSTRSRLTKMGSRSHPTGSKSGRYKFSERGLPPPGRIFDGAQNCQCSPGSRIASAHTTHFFSITVLARPKSSSSPMRGATALSPALSWCQVFSGISHFFLAFSSIAVYSSLLPLCLNAVVQIQTSELA
ncbi:hypothetical protein FA95DRAFT_407757 [Auriscalpium vulgare]|uniref:Uncharacterized protein n=1 Tax=Auriscalpium vulgare TaxID=40419 RepID=A0ACB8RGT0_9AGAM|nr:hypothetical protein FA95DRAFT_407757 [Auriscalpium vulgare]